MEIPTHPELVASIDAFLARHGMAETRLGRDAIGEADFVRTVREGRKPNLGTLGRLDAFMKSEDARLALCATCGERPDSPVARACTAANCGLRAQEAA